MKIDTKYCVLDDVGCGVFEQKKYKYGKTINNLPYKDPDKFSKKLYEYHKELWNGRNIQNTNNLCLELDEDGYGGYCLWLNKIKITSDYIGPSTYWANNIGILDEEIGEYLKSTRTIGGHLIWPCKSVHTGEWIFNKKTKQMEKEKKSINTARGGEKGFYDRIDLTLLDLKNWYECRPCKLKIFFDTNKEWLNIFKSFPGFIEFFLLQDFVDKNYNIQDLASYNDEKDIYEILKSIDNPMHRETKSSYRKFISGNKRVIENRNNRIIILKMKQ
ncbi:hypothetical protein KPL39_04755 [Clostridium gasigenes]|uniref:DUF6994 family protein n=1 Tax=Clostridium gasigenes TaxID=94869 RepID=UPI001C0DD136|nr:hypothetical protein [Clostridium gasigenes]MBU3135573.1 hypothetical protein [Clostridium gasigenes]